jgi:hypothetical protein
MNASTHASKTTFTLNTATMTLTCPDGTTKRMEATGDPADEFYGEWKDIGLFYYKGRDDHWFQGQTPTYPSSPVLSFPKLKVLPAKPVAEQSPLSKKRFADRVLTLLRQHPDTYPPTIKVETLLGSEESHERIAVKHTITFYDEDKRKWVITNTLYHDGFHEAHAKTMYPFTDGTHADFDGAKVGTRKGWFEVVNGEWKCVDVYE